MGEGIKARRRKAVAKNVWAVYDLKYVRDDESVTTGSFSARSDATKVASSSYVVQSNGSFYLNGGDHTKMENLTVGMYIVNITEYSDGQISGKYLYEVTKKLYSSGVTIQYKRYTSKQVKGDTFIRQVRSKAMDYPVNGIQGNYWYVLIKGI